MDIKCRRKVLGMTRSKLAKQLGVSTTAVYKWEKGLTMPRGGKLQQLASILACSIDDLFAEDKAS